MRGGRPHSPRPPPRSARVMPTITASHLSRSAILPRGHTGIVRRRRGPARQPPRPWWFCSAPPISGDGGVRSAPTNLCGAEGVGRSKLSASLKAFINSHEGLTDAALSVPMAHALTDTTVASRPQANAGLQGFDDGGADVDVVEPLDALHPAWALRVDLHHLVADHVDADEEHSVGDEFVG